MLPIRENRSLLGSKKFCVEILLNPLQLCQEFGPRFDNTAIVSQIQVDGSSFLKEDYGLVDEFGIYGLGVLNFESAKVGESFIKIGVGQLWRVDNSPYSMQFNYPVEKVWTSTVKKDENYIEILQESDVVGGYAYAYSKRYSLNDSTRQLRIEYQLTNIGMKTFGLEHYNHNYFQPDQSPINEDYVMESGFDLTAGIESDVPEWVMVNKDSMKLNRRISMPGRFKTGSVAEPTSNWFKIKHLHKKCEILISGDFCVSRFVLFVQKDAICPEVFYSTQIQPGETAKWSREYLFIS